jgi:late competence protein required for DNA uptake (superfamily II DNA/RNA helicase)
MKKKKQKIKPEHLKEFLFGWLWVEKNIMQDVRNKLKKKYKADNFEKLKQKLKKCPHNRSDYLCDGKYCKDCVFNEDKF